MLITSFAFNHYENKMGRAEISQTLEKKYVFGESQKATCIPFSSVQFLFSFHRQIPGAQALLPSSPGLEGTF